MNSNFNHCHLSLILLLIGLSFYSCQKKYDFLPENLNFIVVDKKQTYQINNNEELNAFIKATIGNTQIRILESSFEEAESKSGKFYVIKSKYDVGGFVTSVAIALKEQETSVHKSMQRTMMLSPSCTMSCSPNTYCTGCNQTVIEMCESQLCSCNGGTSPSASCSSSIKFGGNQE